MDELRGERDLIGNEKLDCGKTDGTIFDFTVFKDPISFASVIFHKGSTDDAKDAQNEMLAMMNDLKKYNSENVNKIKSGEETLVNAEMLYIARNKVINAFEDGVFPYKDGF